MSAASRRSHSRQSASERHTWSSNASSWVWRSGASDFDLNLTFCLLLTKRARSHLATTTIGRFWNSTVDLPSYPDGRRRGVEAEVSCDVADRSRAARAGCPQLELTSGRGRGQVRDRLSIR